MDTTVWRFFLGAIGYGVGGEGAGLATWALPL